MLETLRDQYDYIDKEFSDPRTQDRFLVRTPVPIILITILYLLLTKYILPLYMEKRKPLKLKNVIFYYNLLQVVVSSYLVYMSIIGSGYGRRYNIFKCRDLDMSRTDPDALMAMESVYFYYLVKIMEFLDTIFFVLRKKNNQVTFLHIYHHSTMALNGWMGSKFLPGGVAAMFVAVNSTIHTVMYTYYLLSSLGPQWQKYLWWKKYLTQFQIIQFCYGVVAIVGIVISSDNCPQVFRRKFILKYIFFYILSMLYLFYDFYKKSYDKKGQLQHGNKIKRKMK